MHIDLLFITRNRLPYAELSLPALLADKEEEFNLVIWDNGSTDGTREYLESVKDPRIRRRVLSRENHCLHGAANEFFSGSSADLVGIIPDDIIMAPGWTTPIGRAHAEVPELGLIGCWHLGREFFDEARVRHKLHCFGNHQILRHPWTGGGAGLVKLDAIRKCGPLESSATTRYWIKMASKGYVNGYYYPLIHVEHMDYPWSEHFAYRESMDEWFRTSSGAKRHGFRSVADAKAWHRFSIGPVLDGPWEAKYYLGWRAKWRNVKNRLRKICTGVRF